MHRVGGTGSLHRGVMELVALTSVLPRDLVACPKGEQDRVEALVALAGKILEMSP